MEYIKQRLTQDIAKKILGNKKNAEKYLIITNQINPVKGLRLKSITRGVCKGDIRLDLSTKELWDCVVSSWNYDIGLQVIREIFVQSKKYKLGKEADKSISILRGEWEKLKLGNIEWPFSQGDFDGFVQRINSESCCGFEKDNKVKLAAVKYRRIKELNTVRNDFIETLIFKKNKNILPTLNHRKGVDFFIDGVSFDQKVAKSPTIEFKREFGDNWLSHAINNPKTVAEFLYKHQDEGRFGADPRLLVVYLREDVSINNIVETIKNTDLTNPVEINFTYKHKIQGEKAYKVPCFVILLY